MRKAASKIRFVAAVLAYEPPGLFVPRTRHFKSMRDCQAAMAVLPESCLPAHHYDLIAKGSASRMVYRSTRTALGYHGVSGAYEWAKWDEAN